MSSLPREPGELEENDRTQRGCEAEDCSGEMLGPVKDRSKGAAPEEEQTRKERAREYKNQQAEPMRAGPSSQQGAVFQ